MMIINIAYMKTNEMSAPETQVNITPMRHCVWHSKHTQQQKERERKRERRIRSKHHYIERDDNMF